MEILNGGRFGKWEVREYVISDEDLKKSMNDRDYNKLKETVAALQQMMVKVTFNYEFFDEEGNLLPDQESYAHLLHFKRDRLIQSNHQLVMPKLKSICDPTKEDYKKTLEVVNRTMNSASKGKYSCVDYCAFYEARSSYYLLFLQYKIKLNDIT